VTTAPPVTPGALLRQLPAGPIDAERHLWGFGGLHGGLTVALLTAAMRRGAPDGARLRSASARLYRPLGGAFGLETALLRPGRVTRLAAQASAHGRVHADASAIFAAEESAACPPITPLPVPAPPPSDCELFVIPPEFVPISAFMEIRAVGQNRPYAGCSAPELTAWIRLTEDEEPPDACRLILLMDALAPSYAAVLTDLRPIPTVELTVRPGHGLQRASSPWLLLHARTRCANAAGWVEELIDAWDPDGVHLGSASQLRVVRGSAPS
jgi:Thioesterase-like superfamily